MFHNLNLRINPKSELLGRTKLLVRREAHQIRTPERHARARQLRTNPSDA